MHTMALFLFLDTLFARMDLKKRHTTKPLAGYFCIF